MASGMLLTAAAAAAAAIAAPATAETTPAAAGVNFTTLAWTAINQKGETYFPELERSEVLHKPNVGIALSGGGSRAFVANLAYIAALRELGLMQKFRYMAGVSGGGWAVSVYAYARHNYNTPGAPLNMTQLLGPLVPPGEVSMAQLAAMPKGCAWAAATNSLYSQILEYFVDPRCKAAVDSNRSCNSDQLWYQAVNKLYLTPVGIDAGQYFSYDSASVADILARNKGTGLTSADFGVPSLPKAELPYPLFGISVMGPKALAPYPDDNRSYSMLEVSPLYVGQAVTQQLTYRASRAGGPRPVNRTVGGYIEPFAFGSPGPGRGIGGLGCGGDCTLSVQRPVTKLSLAVAAGSGSFAPATILAQNLKPLANLLDITTTYWSPASRSPARESAGTPTLIGDGGITDDTMLIPLLRRGVRTILVCFQVRSERERAVERVSVRARERESRAVAVAVAVAVACQTSKRPRCWLLAGPPHSFDGRRRCCATVVRICVPLCTVALTWTAAAAAGCRRRLPLSPQGDTPLATNATWDVRRRLQPEASEIDADIPAYFGLNIPQPGQDLHRDQVFDTADFADLVQQLQVRAGGTDGQRAGGRGIPGLLEAQGEQCEAKLRAGRGGSPEAAPVPRPSSRPSCLRGRCQRRQRARAAAA
eukprot:SAG22_NODE_2637_length_2347_cov_2.989769_1_plen_646_part_10